MNIMSACFQPGRHMATAKFSLHAATDCRLISLRAPNWMRMKWHDKAALHIGVKGNCKILEFNGKPQMQTAPNSFGRIRQQPGGQEKVPAQRHRLQAHEAANGVVLPQRLKRRRHLPDTRWKDWDCDAVLCEQQTKGRFKEQQSSSKHDGNQPEVRGVWGIPNRTRTSTTLQGFCSTRLQILSLDGRVLLVVVFSTWRTPAHFLQWIHCYELILKSPAWVAHMMPHEIISSCPASDSE